MPYIPGRLSGILDREVPDDLIRRQFRRSQVFDRLGFIIRPGFLEIFCKIRNCLVVFFFGQPPELIYSSLLMLYSSCFHDLIYRITVSIPLF